MVSAVVKVKRIILYNIDLTFYQVRSAISFHRNCIESPYTKQYKDKSKHITFIFKNCELELCCKSIYFPGLVNVDLERSEDDDFKNPPQV